MCLAEALLRVPDEATADQLVGEKIRSGDWGSHLGASSSRFVNASIWGTHADRAGHGAWK